jgi:hypothetical protein
LVATKKVAAKRPANPELIPSDPGLETWVNTTDGVVYLTRIGEYGKKETELIYGRRSFTITPQERRLNQNACAIPAQDFFTNGTLQPKNLLDDEFDTPRLRENPNMINENEIPKIFRLRGEAFSQRLDTITNPATIARLIELAREPRYNATVHQFEMIKRRERALSGEREEPTPAVPDPDGLPRAVTPK